MKVEIKKAGAADAPLIHKLGNEIFPKTYSGIVSPEQIEFMLEWMYSEKNLLAQMESGHVYYIGYIGGEPFGYVSVERESAETFHLQRLYILPGSQGKGLGKVLFEKALSHARAESGGKKCRVILNVNRQNKARGFYEKMGMKKIAEKDSPIGGGFFMCDYIMEIVP